MSSDLFTSSLDNKEYNSLTMEMNVHGTLFLCASYEDENDVDSDQSVSFIIPNNNQGIREAERIILALQNWIDHVKEK